MPPSITLELSDGIMERVQRVAGLNGMSVDAVLMMWIERGEEVEAHWDQIQTALVLHRAYFDFQAAQTLMDMLEQSQKGT
ncbi:MAG: hypothetical protein SGI73_12225 [Chloroflexota bacterium]|nr:hypothetical protein [Chloroflexota bacterium]